jgi:hypothetical protein
MTRDYPGFVYFIEAVGTPFLKIGYSERPYERLRSLRTGCPVEVQMLAVAGALRSQEQKFHRLFAPTRIRGEWFIRSPEIDHAIEWANSYNGGCVASEDQLAALIAADRG